MFRRVRRYALRVPPVCVLGTPVARAESASLELELLALPLPASPAVTVDRTGNDSRSQPETRKDHLSVGALGGTGFPRPLAVEGVVRLERSVLVGLEYSALRAIDLLRIGILF